MSGKRQGKSCKATDVIYIDPDTVRFTHSRIRPFFSGCGRRIIDTLDDLRTGRMSIEELPVITIIDNQGSFFSLNNRRLYVLKALRKADMLRNNVVKVRIKTALEREIERYTPDRCALDATIMPEHGIDDAKSIEVDELAISVSAVGSTQEPKAQEPDKNTLRPKKPSYLENPKILQSIKKLTVLVERGKTKQVAAQLNDWVKDGTLNHSQACELGINIGIT